MSITGSMMSPRISKVPAIAPINFRPLRLGDGGPTCAIGFPCRVIRIGFLVLLTSSSNDKHFALNSDIGISSIVPACFFIKYIVHWSYFLTTGKLSHFPNRTSDFLLLTSYFVIPSYCPPSIPANPRLPACLLLREKSHFH